MWTEDVPGMANNWYFAMSIMYGDCPDGLGGGMFNGIAIKL